MVGVGGGERETVKCCKPCKIASPKCFVHKYVIVIKLKNVSGIREIVVGIWGFLGFFFFFFFF